MMNQLNFALAKRNLGSGHSSDDPFHSLVISVLQDLSQKPWVEINLNDSTFNKYAIEWHHLTFSTLGNKSLPFLCDVRKIEYSDSAQETKEKEFVELCRQYMDQEIVLKKICFSNDKLSFLNIESNEIEDFTNLYKIPQLNSGEKAHRIIYLLLNQQSFSLISKLELLYPNDLKYAEELIDQINRFDIFQYDLCKKNFDLTCTKMSKSTEIIDKINSNIRLLAQCSTFEEIFKIALPDDPINFILEELKKVESKLTAFENASSRSSIIDYIAKSMFYPIRDQVLKEKEIYETTSREMAERKIVLKNLNNQLNLEIETAENELQQYKFNLSKSKSKIQSLNKLFGNKETLSKVEQEKKLQLEAKVKDLKEKQAFCDFIKKIESMPPKDCKPAWVELQNINKVLNHWSLPKLIKKVSKLFKIKITEELSSRMQNKQNQESDKQQIIQTLQAIIQIPNYDGLSSNTTLIITANNLIFSNEFDEIEGRIRKSKCRENGISIQEVHIICQGNLILDVNIESDTFSGIILIFLARNIVASDHNIIIDVSGRNATVITPVKAKNGATEGSPGADGNNGIAGGNGGSVYIRATQAMVNRSNISIKCDGGHGSNGQEGGDGREGRNGKPGDNANPGPKPYWINVFSEYKYFIDGEKGLDGEPGGKGGVGGHGGEGGKGGKLIIQSGDGEEENKQFENGDDGKPASNGFDGPQGLKGMDGEDVGWGREGTWYDWECVSGYNLHVEPMYHGWFGGLTGYKIVKGEPPVITTHNTNLSRSNKVNKTARNKSSQQRKIDLKATEALISTIISEDTIKNLATAENKLANNIQQTESEIQNLATSTEQHQSRISRATAELSTELNILNEIEQNKIATSNQIQHQIQLATRFRNAIEESNLKEENAELKAKELDKIAINLARAQEEASEMIMSTQLQSLTQQQVVQSVLRDASTTSDDYGYNTLAGRSTNKLCTSGQLHQISNETYMFFANITQRHQNPFKDMLETVIQQIIQDVGSIHVYPEIKLLLSQLCENVVDNDLEIEYIKNCLYHDILCCVTNKAVAKEVLLPRGSSIFEVAYNLRMRLSTEINLDKDQLKIIDAPEIVMNYFQELESVGIYNRTLADIEKKDEYQALKRVLASAHKLFQEIWTVFPYKTSDNYKEFINDVLSNCEESDYSLEYGLIKIPEFKYSWIKGKLLELKAQPESKNIERQQADSIKQIKFVLSKPVLKVDELQKIRRELSDLKNLRINKEIDNTVLQAYKTAFQNPRINSIRAVCSKTSDVQTKEIVNQLEKILESSYQNIELQKRIEYYESIKRVLSNSKSSKLVKTMKKILQEIYQKYIPNISGPGEFIQFLEASLNPPNTETTNKILFILEIGLLNQNLEIIEVSTANLCLVENVLWNFLSEETEEHVKLIQSLVEKKLKFDVTTPETRCNTENCRAVCGEILNYSLQFVPVDLEGSGVTNATKLRKYIKFSLCRIELFLYLNNQCSEIQLLNERITNAEDKHDPNTITNILNNFFYPLCIPSEFTTFESLIDHLTTVDFEKIPIKKFESLLYRSIEFIDFTEFIPSTSCEEKISEIKGNINGADRKDYKFDLLLAVIDGMKGTKSYPTSQLQELNLMISNNYKNINSLYSRMEVLLQSLRTECTDSNNDNFDNINLFAAANFTDKVQSEILEKLNLHNVSDFEKELEDLWFKVARDEKNDPVKFRVTLKMLTMISKVTFSFMKELDIILNISFPKSPKIKPKVKYNIFKACGEHHLYSVDCDCWGKFQKVLKQTQELSNVIEEKYNQELIFQIIKIFLDVAFEDPARLFIRRILENISIISEENINLPFKKLNNSSQLEIYRSLIPEFDSDKIKKYILNAEEQSYFDTVLRITEKPVFLELKKKIEEDILTKHATKYWKGLLEIILFQTVFKKLSAKIVNVDQKNSLADTVELTKVLEKKPIAKRWIKSSQTATVLIPTFKLAYFLQSPPKRIEWLCLINDALEKVKNTNPSVFSTAKDFTTFFTFAMELNYENFENIIRNRFPENWLKEVLVGCILRDAQIICKNKCEHFNVNVEQELNKYLKEIDPYKIKFLLILHPTLQRECELLDPTSIVDVKTIADILYSLNNCELTRKLQLDLNLLFQNYPYISYWKRLIRLQKLKTYDLSQNLIDKCLGMDEKFGDNKIDKLCERLNQLANIASFTPEELEKIVKCFSSYEWILDDTTLNELKNHATSNFANIERVITTYSETKRKTPHEMESLINEISENVLNQTAEAKITMSWSKELYNKVQKLLREKYSYKLPLKPPAFKLLLKKQTNAYFKDFNSRHWDNFINVNNSSSVELIANTVALIYRGIQYHFSMDEPDTKVTEQSRVPRDSQLLSLFFLISGKKGGGKMGEIETGEGKSCIIAMFACFCSLLKARVHIITSNEVLAKEDEEKYRSFYELFGLTVSNNCDKEAVGDKERKVRYNNNIVYGELGGFQADILNTEFYLKEIMPKPADVVIVDEVDSLLLDKGANMLYLAHDIPELKYLRPIFLIIWEAVMRRIIDVNSCPSWRQYSELDVNIVRRSVEEKLQAEKDTIIYPKCLEEFIKKRLGVWVKQAFRARFLPLNEDYVIQENTQKVINMDKDTGVKQGNMHLSLGLQQFLQLRYRSKLSAETLKCVFISNLRYFQKHHGKIYGISGTLGGEDELSLLAAKYKVQFFGMPRFKLNKRIEKDPIIGITKEAWGKGIIQSVLDHTENQPILIICENVARLHEVKEFLSLTIEARGINLMEYSCSEKNAKFTTEVKEKGGLKQKDLILSTNLGGRGTDLFVATTSKEPGLHVILSYLPSNLRVEKQGFGRTARAGESGTVQFVILTSPTSTGVVPTIELLKEERKIREIQRLETIKIRDIPKIEIEDELFSKYTEFVNDKVKQSKQIKKLPKRIRELQLQFLNNRWSVWLDSIREQLESISLQMELGKRSIDRKFEQFKESISFKMDSGSLELFAEYNSELTKLGICYENLAIKSFISAMSQAEYDEAGNIMEESWEKVKAGFSRRVGRKSISTLDKAGTNERITQLLEYSKTPSNLTNGIKCLQNAIGKEAIISDSPSLYLGTMSLNDEPTNRKIAKRNLKESKNKILQRMSQNMSCITLLKQATDAGSTRVTSGINKFEEQMNSEVNLFQIHVDSINDALHLPITPTYFLNKDIEKQEAKAIYNLLATPEWNLLKPYRLSKKIKLNENGELEFNSNIQFEKELQLLCSLAELKTILASRIRTEEKFVSEIIPISEEHFANTVLTKAKFLNILQKHGITQKEATNSQIIAIDEEPQDHDFPNPLRPYKDALILILRDRNGNTFDETQIQNTLNLNPEKDEEILQSLIKTLRKLGWIKELEHCILKIDKEFVRTKIDFENYNWNWSDPEPPSELKPFLDLILPLICLKDSSVPFNFIEYAAIPFPENEAEGSNDIFKILISSNVIKQPKVEFKNLSSRDEIQKRLESIENTFNSEKFQIKLREICSKFTSNKKTVEEHEFKKYSEQILQSLLKSIGTLKKNHKIRVNYHEISVMVPITSNQSCEELQDLIREGIFHRIFTLDEFIRWYENPATAVLFLGMAEVALGVYLETLSFGILSPLGAWLISEGASDMYYSTKELWRGERLNGADYWEYKKSSMLISLFPYGGGTAGKFVLRSGIGKKILTRLLYELCLAGGKAVVFTFIEDNLHKGVQNNVLGVQRVLDQVMNSSNFEAELNQFRVNAEKLREASFEKNQAQIYLNQLINTISEVNRRSSLDLALERTIYKIRNRLIVGMSKNLVKNTMPIQLDALNGLFGSNEKVIMQCSDEIQNFLLTTLQKFNKEIEQKANRLEAEKQLILSTSSSVQEIQPNENEFKNTIDAVVNAMKSKLRIRVADYVVEFMTGSKVKQRMYETITTGYSRAINETVLGTTTIGEDRTRGMKEEPELDNQDSNQKNTILVNNGGGRTKEEVQVELQKIGIQGEFLTDIHGRTYVSLKSESNYGFVLHKSYSALDEFLEQKARELDENFD